jgi:hypothetical protein
MEGLFRQNGEFGEVHGALAVKAPPIASLLFHRCLKCGKLYR